MVFLNLPLSLASKFNGSAKVIKVGVANEDVTLEILRVNVSKNQRKIIKSRTW